MAASVARFVREFPRPRNVRNIRGRGLPCREGIIVANPRKQRADGSAGPAGRRAGSSRTNCSGPRRLLAMGGKDAAHSMMRCVADPAAGRRESLSHESLQAMTTFVDDETEVATCDGNRETFSPR